MSVFIKENSETKVPIKVGLIVIQGDTERRIGGPNIYEIFSLVVSYNLYIVNYLVRNRILLRTFFNSFTVSFDPK